MGDVDVDMDADTGHETGDKGHKREQGIADTGHRHGTWDVDTGHGCGCRTRAWGTLCPTRRSGHHDMGTVAGRHCAVPCAEHHGMQCGEFLANAALPLAHAEIMLQLRAELGLALLPACLQHSWSCKHENSPAPGPWMVCLGVLSSPASRSVSWCPSVNLGETQIRPWEFPAGCGSLVPSSIPRHDHSSVSLSSFFSLGILPEMEKHPHLLH